MNKSINRILYCFRHCIHSTLLGKVLTTNNGIHGSFHTGEILVIILVQHLYLCNGCVYCTVICRAILKTRIIACLRKRIAQQTCYDTICKFFFRLFSGRTNSVRRSAHSKVAVRINDSTVRSSQISRKNTSSLGIRCSSSLDRRRHLIHIAILNGQF